MARPDPTRLFHFTRAEHLPTIIAHGLLSDTLARARGLMQIEVGQTSIKTQRARTVVPVAAGGLVADYVPFYFAPRSPMMHNIYTGRVPTYQDGCDRLIYLATTTQTLFAAGVTWAATDRNAALAVARFTTVDSEMDDLIAWDIMEIWACTPDGDRIERRMAEFLVHERVDFANLMAVGVMNDAMREEVETMISAASVQIPVYVRPKWYF